ncbi:putative RNA polymerase sigma factor [Deinococcus aerius]|uniref:Putative RNA polymerase sigma factor n=1 Tax=Deinococcus aerius TaxID=200253 RepID=A0A2I9DNI6_9DEIO|nr:hypothetical protein [Deinococcus aerius]GBF06641.1 putative RNA polymerase sigma factor [Deinococcus aerius]
MFLSGQGKSSGRPVTGREGHSDAELLCALPRGDPRALRELHRRYAPSLYALARRAGHHDPEPHVQEAFLLIARRADCHARTALEARTWIMAVARRALVGTGSQA